MDGFYSFLFYGLIAVGAVLIISLTVLRIDWARHPEKYKKDVENYEKEQDQEAAIKKAKEKEKAKKRQARVDKLNQYRAINGKGPLAEKNKTSKKK